MIENVEISSCFDDYDDFQFFVLRKIRLDINSICFNPDIFIIKHLEIYSYDRIHQNFFKISLDDLNNIIDKVFINNQHLISSYSIEVEKLEISLFERNVPNYFMDLWFDLKKDIAKIDNYYDQSSLVYSTSIKKAGKLVQEINETLRDIDQTVSLQKSSITTLKSRLDSLHHYYDSIKNDRLNKTIVLLTIISGIFLPLNLIVGFFGMNTEGLFFSGYQDGTQRVLLILGAVLVVVILGSKIINIIDRNILRYFLGKYDFYQSMLAKVSDLEKRLKGE